LYYHSTSLVGFGKKTDNIRSLRAVERKDRALEQRLDSAHVTPALKISELMIPVIKMIGMIFGRRYQFCIYVFLTRS